MPTAATAVTDRLAAIAATRRALLADLQGLTTAQGAWRPASGQWSLQEVVEHLYLAESGGFDLIWQAAESFRDGEPVWSGDSPNAGLPIEEVIRRTWRPRETAPESATPAGKLSLSCGLARLAACDSLLAALPDHLAGLPLEQVIYPHFLSGPLDALQRLEFIRFHLEYHGPQIRRLKQAQGLG